MATSIFLASYVRCTSHLANGYVYLQQDANKLRLTLFLQAEACRQHVGAYGGGTGAMAGGDYNQNPQDLPSGWYSGFYETDGSGSQIRLVSFLHDH